VAVTPSKTEEAFLREVDEEVRRDQMVSVWKNYGRLIIAAIIAGLAIFGAILGWRAWSHSNEEAETLKLQQAFDAVGSGDAKGAKTSFDALAKDGAPGNRAIATLMQANALLAAGDAKGAAAKFGEVAGDTSVAQPLRDLATIRQTYTEFDTLQPQTIIDRLKPLATKDSDWLGSAGEMTAMAYRRMNKPNEARAMFKTIAESDKVPQPIRERAVQAVDGLDVGTNDQKGK
jgi:hypothetical protein